MTEESQAMKFDNGLPEKEIDALIEIDIKISDLKMEIEQLGRHRSYSLAITKLDEAHHWLRDRKHRPAQ